MTTLVIPTTALAVKSPLQGHWTYSDWEKLPADGNRYEIIDGVLYVSTAPSLFHQWIVQQFYDLVGAPAKRAKLGVPFFAPVGVIMPNCDPVQPDFVFVLASNLSILKDRRIMGVPDLIVEALSPGTAAYDEDVKLKAYANAGVAEYAVIDPEKLTPRLYTLEKVSKYSAPREYSNEDIMSFSCLPTITLRVGDLFANAPDTSL